MLFTKYRTLYGILWIEVFSFIANRGVLTEAAKSIDECETEILVSVFSTLALCFMVFAIILIACFMARKNQRRPLKQYSTGNQHSHNDIEGRRNKVFEDEKDDDEFPNGGRKRQDSGFIASSNESIVPLPEMYNLGPRRSPSMPNLRLNSNNEQQTNPEGEVFALEANGIRKSQQNCPKMVSVGLSTDDLDHNMNFKSMVHPRLTETVVIQKKSFNCTGIDFGVGGVYVKDFDKREISFEKGELSIGDEVLSINDYPLNGLTNMEAFSFFAKSGPEVKLKIIRGVFVDKADNTSLCSADYQMSETSTDNEIENQDQNIFTQTGIPKSLSGHTLNRLPRVIADADNLSFDDNESMDLTAIKRNTSDSYLLKTINTVHSNNSSQSESGSPNRYVSEYPSEATTRTDYHGKNGIKATNNTLEVHQELSKILLANPNLFMDFLASVQAKEKPCPRLNRASNDSCDHCQHSRNTSSERQRQSSRHEQYSHGGHTHYGSDYRHNRNCSCENQRYLSHNEDTKEEQSYSKFRRTNSSDDLGSNVNGHSKIYRSQSVEGTTNSPIFTIDSYSRHTPEQNLINRPVTDSLPQQSHPQKQPSDVEQKQRLYELLKQKASLEQLIQQHQQQNKSNELVNTNHTENVVVQRGYNNDYIVPINSSPFPNVATSYNKPMHRSKDNSPVRRTSPVVFPTQNVPRFVATATINNTITTTGSDYRQSSSPHLGSPQNSIVAATPVTLNRKPPPDYASIKRNTSDHSGDESTVAVCPVASPQRDTVNIDADFMRKMTQKYSEPRIRKNPPPYYNAVSDGNEGVVLRKKANDSSNRSRPHSYTETGGNITYDPSVVFNDPTRFNHNHPVTANVINEPDIEMDIEKRKHPKRTHSMPAVKQVNLRPLAAQAFLTNNTSNEHLTQIPPPIVPQYQPPPPFTPQIPQYPTPQQSATQPVPQYNEPVAQQASAVPYLTHATSEETLQSSIEQDDYQQAPKKLCTRQQRAQESFNRRKSIDSGTLRKLAEEMYENPALGGEYPLLSHLLGESQFTASERRSQALYRHKSTEALFTQF